MIIPRTSIHNRIDDALCANLLLHDLQFFLAQAVAVGKDNLVEPSQENPLIFE